MTMIRRLAPPLVALLLGGCSGADPDRPSPVLDPGPHRGALAKVDGAEGFVEVVTEPVRGAEAGGPKSRVAVYWLDRAQTGAIRPEPTDVTLTATWPGATAAAEIHLTAEPVPGDPAGAAKFVAPAADRPGQPRGTVRARLGDRAVSAAF